VKGTDYPCKFYSVIILCRTLNSFSTLLVKNTFENPYKMTHKIHRIYPVD
jgi:hypothetical protein